LAYLLQWRRGITDPSTHGNFSLSFVVVFVLTHGNFSLFRRSPLYLAARFVLDFCEFVVVFVGFLVICVDRCGFVGFSVVEVGLLGFGFFFFLDLSDLPWWLLVLLILALWGCQ
jgi:hypothetical protein